MLAALHDAAIPATDVYYSDTGEAPTPGQTSFILWLVLVPTETLSAARSVIAPLPVSCTDAPVAPVAPASVRTAHIVVAIVAAFLLLLVSFLARAEHPPRAFLTPHSQSVPFDPPPPTPPHPEGRLSIAIVVCFSTDSSLLVLP